MSYVYYDYPASYDELKTLEDHLAGRTIESVDIPVLKSLWKKLGDTIPKGPMYRGLSLDPSYGTQHSEYLFNNMTFQVKYHSSAIESWTMNEEIAIKKFATAGMSGVVFKRNVIDPEKFVFAYNEEVYRAFMSMEQDLQEGGKEDELELGAFDELTTYRHEEEVLMEPHLEPMVYSICHSEIVYVILALSSLGYTKLSNPDGYETLYKILMPRLDEETEEQFEIWHNGRYPKEHKIGVFVCNEGRLSLQDIVDKVDSEYWQEQEMMY